MPDENIANYAWRLPTDEFSSLCDNVMLLDGTTSLSGSPVRQNAQGICPPSCSVCITPFGTRTPIGGTNEYFLDDVSLVGSPHTNPRDIRRYGTGAFSISPRLFRDDAPDDDYDHTAMRFEGVEIPQGTTITSATLEWSGTLGVPTGIIPEPNIGQYTIYCEDADDATELPLDKNISSWNSLTKTTASVAKTADTDSGETEWSADVTALVNEVVARSGWGNSLNFLFETNLVSGSATWILNFNYDTTTTPKLTIEI